MKEPMATNCKNKRGQTGWEAVNMWENDKVEECKHSDRSREAPQLSRAPPPEHRRSKQKAEQEHRRSLTLTARPSHDPGETGNRKWDL